MSFSATNYFTQRDKTSKKQGSEKYKKDLNNCKIKIVISLTKLKKNATFSWSSKG